MVQQMKTRFITQKKVHESFRVLRSVQNVTESIASKDKRTVRPLSSYIISLPTLGCNKIIIEWLISNNNKKNQLNWSAHQNNPITIPSKCSIYVHLNNTITYFCHYYFCIFHLRLHQINLILKPDYLMNTIL